MQTFLPYGRDFSATARALDRQRLGKQRVETLQILRTLAGITDGWRNHPAVKMWRGHEFRLACYGMTICNTWRDRGYTDTCADKIMDIMREHRDWDRSLPAWIDDPDLALSHQSNLLRKNPDHYGALFPGVPSNLPYKWPV